MEFHEAVNRLERLRRLRPKLGTETTASLLAYLDVPYDDLASVQVAGSNGKGSTARILESILAESGVRVGLYTSPDLNGLRERIRVDRRQIPKRDVTAFVEAIGPYVVDRSVVGDAPTYFEVMTAMALWHFDREEVDVAVLEVGIGGRYDATSVVDPVASAVTSVSLEHTDIIGSTVEEIAADKSSVAPEGRPLVTGTTGRALETIQTNTDVVTVGGEAIARDGGADGGRREANDEAAIGDGSGVGAGGETATEDAIGERATRGADVEHLATDVVASERGMVSTTESRISIRGPDWSVDTESPLLGQHQAENAAIAATLARQVAEPSTADLAAGIRNVHWPGRFEVMETDPLVVLDGAHNPAACETLSALVDRFDVETLSVVFGAMRDKDHGAMCRALPAADRAFVAEPAVERAQDRETLAAVFDRETGADVEQCGTVFEALERAIDTSGERDGVLVTGSLYVVGEARDRWTRAPRVVRTDTPARTDALLRSADVPAPRRREIAGRTAGRSIAFHVRRPAAEELQTRMATIGGTCGVSGIDVTDSHVMVVLSGTPDEFRALVDAYGQDDGEAHHVATQVSAALDLGDDSLGVGDDTPDLGDDSLGIGADALGTEDGALGTWRGSTRRPAVMGILNVTPDSFHDGGVYEAVDDAVERAREMIADGADVIDVGGESTRPGADPVSAAVERDRVVPVVERIADLDATVSVDTRKPAVAAAALDAGAEVVNDVTGLGDASMRRLVADRGASAVVTHSLSAPVEPDRTFEPDDVVDAVVAELTERVLLAERAGIARSNLIVDPGLGFGTSPDDSFALLDRLAEFHALDTPVMVGHSRKSMFASVSGATGDRFVPTVAATALAAERGADVVRVHDVAAAVDAIGTVARTTRDR